MYNTLVEETKSNTFMRNVQICVKLFTIYSLNTNIMYTNSNDSNYVCAFGERTGLNFCEVLCLTSFS